MALDTFPKEGQSIVFEVHTIPKGKNKFHNSSSFCV